jgi:hypothetical protein
LLAEGPNQATVTAYFDAIEKLPQPKGRVATWPIATLMPFLAQPDRHMFLKPEITQEAEARLGFHLSYKPHPNWLTYKKLLELTELLLNDPSHAGLFWLRVFGVLVDLPKYLAGISDASAATQAVENVRASLTRDELIWTQYRRDSECHIVVDAYAPLRRGNGSPNAAVTAKTLPDAPSIPWAEFQESLSSAWA